MGDELDQLIVDEEVLDKKNLADLLVGKVTVNKSGDIILNESIDSEKASKKVLYFLLGKKVATIKKMKEGIVEDADRTEIANAVGIEPKSVSTYLGRELKGIVKSKSGKFSVPNYNLSKCKVHFNE